MEIAWIGQGFVISKLHSMISTSVARLYISICHRLNTKYTLYPHDVIVLESNLYNYL